MTLVVVVAHLARGRSGLTDSGLELGGSGGVARSGSLGDFDLAAGVAVALVDGGGLGLVGGTVVRDVDGLGRLVLVGVYGLVATVVGDVDFVGGRGPATVLSLSDVELVLDGLVVDLRTFLVADRSVTVVGVAIGERESVEMVSRRCKHINKTTREAGHRSLETVETG